MKKIVLLGPECSGKTTLARELARRYDGAYGPEYSREYAERLRRSGADIGFHDVMPIVRGQLRCEQNALQSGKERAFLDGNPLAEYVYSQWYYHAVPRELTDLLRQRTYDFYLLCYPDLRWIPDPARDMPTGRENIFRLFEKEVAASGVPYHIVRGDGTSRQASAENALRQSGLLP